MHDPKSKPQRRYSDNKGERKEEIKFEHKVGFGNNYFPKNSVTPEKTRVSEGGVQENLEKRLDICFVKSPRAAKTP
jgi:hypothetical protein